MKPNSKSNRTVLAVFHDAGLAGAELVLLSHLTALRAAGTRVVAVLPRRGALEGALRGVAAAVHFHAAPWWIRLQGSRTHARAWDETARGGLRLRLDQSVAGLTRIITEEQPAAVVSAAAVLLSPALAARQAGVASLQFIHEWPGRREPAGAGWDSAVSWRDSLAVLRAVNHRLIWSSPACAVAWEAGPEVLQGPSGGSAQAIAAAWQHRRAQSEVEQFLPHPVNCEAYGLNGRGKASRNRLAGVSLHLINVATWSERKGTDRMVAILAALHERGVPFTATLVGRQPADRFARKLAAQIARAPFADRVVVRAYADDLPGLFAASDVLVHPAREDTSPLILAHAMAAGLPVVASDLPGIREMLTGYRPDAAPCGRLLSPTDLEPWIALLAEPTGLLNRQAAHTARALARKTFEAARVHRQFGTMLDAAIASAAEAAAGDVGMSTLRGLDAGRLSARAALWAVQDEALDFGRGLVARLGRKGR
ncbi:MAG TPA: glycosyltransferase [Planctomycetota bacterium]|nr:glycosyltransferase [Planctomycetota bacterium]